MTFWVIMKFFYSKGDLHSIIKLLLPEKLLLGKFSLALLVSSGSALCFPLAMVLHI